MNDPAFHECAQVLGKRMQDSAGESVHDKIALGYRAATSQKITSDRLSELHKLYIELKESYQNDPALSKALAETPEGAAFAVVASVLLNLDEAITR